MIFSIRAKRLNRLQTRFFYDIIPSIGTEGDYAR